MMFWAMTFVVMSLVIAAASPVARLAEGKMLPRARRCTGFLQRAACPLLPVDVTRKLPKGRRFTRPTSWRSGCGIRTSLRCCGPWLVFFVTVQKVMLLTEVIMPSSPRYIEGPRVTGT